jgi:hypothetical protein
LQTLFTGRRKTGRWHLEAIETTVRSAMHQAGAAALNQLLQFPAPEGDQRIVSCPCGKQARYQELRAKPILTAVGPVKVWRPYYLCAHCHTPASSPPMSSWISSLRNSLPECAACRLW